MWKGVFALPSTRQLRHYKYVFIYLVAQGYTTKAPNFPQRAHFAIPPGVSDVIIKLIMTKAHQAGNGTEVGFIAHDELYPQPQIILHNGALEGFVRYNLHPYRPRMHINEAERKPHLEVLDVAPTELEQTEALHQQDAAEVACDTEEPFKEARKMADLPCDKDSLFQCLLYLLGVQRTPGNIFNLREEVYSWLDPNKGFIYVRANGALSKSSPFLKYKLPGWKDIRISTC